MRPAPLTHHNFTTTGTNTLTTHLAHTHNCPTLTLNTIYETPTHITIEATHTAHTGHPAPATLRFTTDTTLAEIAAAANTGNTAALEQVITGHEDPLFVQYLTRPAAAA